MRIIILIYFSALVMGCSTDYSITEVNPDNENNRSLGYVQGEVSFGLKDSVTLMELADYIYSLDNIFIKDVASFQYYTILPEDSMQIIKSRLEAEPYIWDENVNVSYNETDSKILIDFWIKDFKSENIQDWASLKARFSLIHIPYYFQLGLLKVEIGKEEEWINNLVDVNLFRFVELNHIDHMN